MDFYCGKKRLISYLSSAFAIASISSILLSLLSLIQIKMLDHSLALFDQLEPAVYGILFGGFASLFVISNTKKSIYIVFVIAFASLLFYSFSGISFSAVVCIILSVLLASMCDKMSNISFIVSSLLLAVLVSTSLGLLYPFFFDWLKAFCHAISGKGAVFGVLNDVYSVLFSNSLSNLFYHYDYSSAQLVGDEIVSGAVDIFVASKETLFVVAKYLSGKYFVNVFLSLGVCIALLSRLDDKTRLPLILLTISCVISGKTVLLSLFLLCYNPFLYFGYLFCIFVAYFVARFVDIRIGFVQNGGLVELIKYGEKWVYFVLIGVILCILLYFVFLLVLSRFDFDNHKVLPKQIRQIVLALGGERNIKRIDTNKVYVYNPNLIDILRLDCEIHEDEIILLDDDIDILHKYF